MFNLLTSLIFCTKTAPDIYYWIELERERHQERCRYTQRIYTVLALHLSESFQPYQAMYVNIRTQRLFSANVTSRQSCMHRVMEYQARPILHRLSDKLHEGLPTPETIHIVPADCELNGPCSPVLIGHLLTLDIAFGLLYYTITCILRDVAYCRL